MGVYGLTTYLREHRRNVSQHLEFGKGVGQAEHVALVVDGWSLIYKVIMDADLPWVYGGEYSDFARILVDVVKAWQSVGLKPVFVLDGFTPPKKFGTVISRLNQNHVQPSLLFFRTSAAARSKHRFLKDCWIIPPLIYDVCVQALLAYRESQTVGDSLALEIHFADEESDAFAVEIAGRYNGYIVGNDSDFVVLNCEGYAGSLPLNDMAWSVPEKPSEPSPTDDDSFQTVKSKKKTSKAVVAQAADVGRGIIPPSDMEGVWLSATLYTPQALAAHLNLPVSLLPLMGSLLGNDYTMHNSLSPQTYSLLATPRSSPPPSQKSFHNLLFERNATLSQRVEKAATTLRQILHPTASRKKPVKTPGSVVELIDMSVSSLLQSSKTPTSQIGLGVSSAIVEKVVEGTLPYAIAARPADADIDPMICVLHDPLYCTLFPVFDRTEGSRIEMSMRYIQAYRAGAFAPSLVDVLSSGTYWPEIFLESPDIKSVGGELCREIRRFGYAILDDALGLPVREEDEEENEEDGAGNEDGDAEVEDEEDEVIDVVEDYSDEEVGVGDDGSSDLSEVDKLRGALRNLSESFEVDDDGPEVEEDDGIVDVHSSEIVTSSVPRDRSRSRSRSISNKPKVITEYVRKGIRVVGEDVEVPRLSYFDEIVQTQSNILLLPQDVRLSIFLRFFESDVSAIRDLGKETLIQPILVVRYLVRQLHERSVDGSKERLQEKWSRREARAFLGCFFESQADVSNESLSPPELISERSIQLTAQILMAVESITHLTQIMFLGDMVPSLAPRFSGRMFHALLAKAGTAVELPAGIWEVATDGLDGACFTEERSKKKKKASGPPPVAGKALAKPVNGRAKSGRFSFLSSMDDDD